jgi:hypothetical protein
VSSNYFAPQVETSDVDGGQERFGILGITGGDAAPQLEMKERVFNEMTQLVEFFIIVALFFSIGFGWDHRLHPL